MIVEAKRQHFGFYIPITGDLKRVMSKKVRLQIEIIDERCEMCEDREYTKDNDKWNIETQKNISLKNNLLNLFEEYKDVKPFKNIEPALWEREIRNEW